MSPKISRPVAMKSLTIVVNSHCGKLFVTISHDEESVREVFIRFGKAGGCGSAQADGVAKLLSYGLRSGMDATDAVKALSGIQCHLGPKTCLNGIAEAIQAVHKHLVNGTSMEDLNSTLSL